MERLEGALHSGAMWKCLKLEATCLQALPLDPQTEVSCKCMPE